jgi:hypothetical protein
MAEAAVQTQPTATMNGTATAGENAPLLTTQQEAVTPLSTAKAESFHSAESSLSQLESQGTPASSAKTTEEEFTLPTDGPLKVPIPTPTTIPPPPATLTGEQEIKYATVLSKVSAWQTLPVSTAKNAAQAPLTEHQRMWLTRECLLRYLRASKWNTANALKRLQSTLSWRREYGADKFTFDYISPENETGKQVILGYDNAARPCLYLNPAKQNTDMSDRQIHHLCFMLDRTVDMLPPGQENACLIINFKGAASGKIPTVGQARQVLNILQGHNPERLGMALISDLPWYVNTFFKLIAPFIDPVTREKMKFNPDMRQYVPPSRLWNAHDGDLNFEYEHAAYWPALEAETKRRREAFRERWERAGKRIGEYEEYLRGGAHPSLAQELEEGGLYQSSGSSSEANVAAKLASLSVKDS